MPLFRRHQQPATDGGRLSGSASPAPAREIEDWRAYDGVAATYARSLEPVTEPPAAELVALLEIRPGARVLDVGTGTGVAARHAANASGPAGMVVGIDPSVPMLAQALANGGPVRYVASTSIDLPFRDAAFDDVCASFVLSHVPDYHTALFESLRVLKPGGRMGVSAWAAGEDRDEFTRAWDEVVEEFAEHEMLQDARTRAVPWEEFFSEPARLKDALHEAGLRDIWLERREYRVETTAETYLAGRETSSSGRFLRDMLGDEFWGTLQARARQVFAERFPPSFNDFHEAVLAVGHKP
jgi:ubiquinone/menaquinone biosynthesis C-methylase UbiE